MAEWLRTKAAAEYFGVAEATIYRWTEKHGLPVHRIGHTNLYRADELDKWATRFRAAQLMRRHRMVTNGD